MWIEGVGDEVLVGMVATLCASMAVVLAWRSTGVHGREAATRQRHTTADGGRGRGQRQEDDSASASVTPSAPPFPSDGDGIEYTPAHSTTSSPSLSTENSFDLAAQNAAPSAPPPPPQEPPPAYESLGVRARSSPPTSESDVSLKIKFLNDAERLIDTNLTTLVRQIKQTHFASELEGNKRVRFIYQGRELADDLSLSANGVNSSGDAERQCTVHCLISDDGRRRANGGQAGATADDADGRRGGRYWRRDYHGQDGDDDDANTGFIIGNLLTPLLGFMLSGIWYCRLVYRHMFDGISTLILFSLTVLFMATFFGRFVHQVQNVFDDAAGHIGRRRERRRDV